MGTVSEKFALALLFFRLSSWTACVGFDHRCVVPLNVLIVPSIDFDFSKKKHDVAPIIAGLKFQSEIEDVS